MYIICVAYIILYHYMSHMGIQTCNVKCISFLYMSHAVIQTCNVRYISLLYMSHAVIQTYEVYIFTADRGGTLSLVVFEKYLLPRKKTHTRAHFVPIDQGNIMQSLAGFFTGWKVVFVLCTFDRLLIFL